MKNNTNFAIVVFLLLVTVLNLFQSSTTELLYDEAYYWVQSHFLDWGFFDHPPMTSLWIAIGTLLFDKELAVRFIPVLMMSLTVYLIWLLIDHPKKSKNPGLFFLLILSTALFNLFGFLALPDTCLYFFTALFLCAYKKMIATEQWRWYLLFSFSLAALMYSKYTAGILIVFVILSNLSLLKNLKFWTAILFAILLFAPHIYWQYRHDFITLNYHLLERSAKYRFTIKQPLQFLVNQLAIIGFTFPIFYATLFTREKPKDLFEKALKYFVIGYVLFVFILSFRIKTQAQWTAPVLIPFMVLVFTYLLKKPNHKRLFIGLATINVVLLVGIRIVIAVEGLLPTALETHGNKKWALALQKQYPNHKKLFHNSYRNAATYWFYTKDTASTYNSTESRKNQFNLMAIHHNWTDKKVLHISEKPREYSNATPLKNDKWLYLTPINKYRSLPNDLFKIQSIRKDKTNKDRMLLQATIQRKLYPSKNLGLYLVFKGIKNNLLGSTPLAYSRTANTSIEGYFELPPNIEWTTVHSLEIAAYLNPETDLESLSKRIKKAPDALD